MTPSTLLRLALAGTRTDTLRVLLTGFSAALATLVLLAALTVLAIPAAGEPGETGGETWSTQYTNALLREPGLRPGVAFTLLLLTIPVLALAGQCARLGAPARDRRLAAIRLAGATPRQVGIIAAAETGTASLLGTTTGLAIYLVGRWLLHRPDAEGRLMLPTDVLPSAGALVAVVLDMPLIAALATVVMLRRVSVTPLGVTRRTRRDRAPRPWPGLLILLGLAAFAAIQPLVQWHARTDRTMPSGLVPLLLIGGGLLAMIGVVLGTAWLSHTTGRVLHRFARRPATLLAARRLTSDPWLGSRTFAALLAAVLFGAGAAGIRAYFVANDQVSAASQRFWDQVEGRTTEPVTGDSFYLQTMDLINLAVVVALVIAVGGLLIAIVESVVARHRAYAALVATGVPRSVLGRSIVWQAMTPAVPAILVASTVGLLLSRGIFPQPRYRGSSSYCDAPVEVCTGPTAHSAPRRTVVAPEFTQAVAVPLDDLALYGAGALGMILLAAMIGVLFLRGSTAVEELRTT
ncbi:FtsX-like permease family protein [Micromonospora polyrhachis]|uniref:ABC3 transporter permease C-terminal domain-containing protein n=1 Tax=Micromonospora polyrhachis TaxID=1282883 RepID=A0A7W7WPG4_9ACTN|nr:FtsX-like permease family protein [Micromonospora polyrhachis]MBB4958669.1 hypothetical protein [Micromonospora polyrhachis]